MHVEFLLEEPSAEAALKELLPRLLPDATWQCHPHRGKHDLLARLPGRLKTYARQLLHTPDLRVVILMDADANCRQAKLALEKLVADAHLVSKTQAAGRPFQVLTRLAVAELEAWFLGDPAAMQAAYPGVRPTHFAGLNRDPDAIPDAWETLWRVLQAGGHYRAGKQKQRWAADISRHLDPARNASASFRYFCAGLAALR
ncbi:DUF4276 family protein [Hymenobacter psoromatis]|uniref:DUF4276 family protein n=1 Tax=Hymenobacter psoromatis TaxID=1484116 RepID=UPI001CBFDCE0|nr:DUF4276 family protein [Hymenobacter psoromatis]